MSTPMRVLISAEQIHQRVSELAEQIAPQYRDRPLTIVGVLRDYDQDHDWNWGLHLAAQTDKIDLFLSPATTERLYTRNPDWKEVGYYGVVARKRV